MEDLIAKILILLCLYFLVAFFVSPIILPNRVLIRTRIERTEKIRKIALSLTSKSKEKTLKNIYHYILNTYSNENYKFLILTRLFKSNVEKVINRPQFLPCYVQNHILVTLLLNTGKFKEEDIKRKEMIGFIPVAVAHQYVLVKIGKHTYRVDPFRRVFHKQR